jgi:hypothetical protein
LKAAATFLTNPNPISIVTPRRPDPAIVLIAVQTAEDVAAAPVVEVAAGDVVVADTTDGVGMVARRATRCGRALSSPGREGPVHTGASWPLRSRKIKG